MKEIAEEFDFEKDDSYDFVGKSMSINKNR